MPTIIGVRFKRTGKIYYFDPAKLEIKVGDGVIVETVRGVEYGDVVIAPREVSEDQVVAPLKEVIRVATPEDHKKVEANSKKEQSALRTCEEKIKKHNLPMSLVDVEYTFDGKKIVFYFTADGRVDFRELVKDLASTFRTRIELRQIGVRDEAKMLGGIGSCGREVCCKSYMGDFHPVSIRMAKDQNISLNPSKISGLCGRLMCCLEYEHDFYRSVKGKLKKVGSTVMTPEGPGTVMDNLVLQEKCKVKVVLPGENFEAMKFPLEEVKGISQEEYDKASQEVAKKPHVSTLFKNPYETWDDMENKDDRSGNANKSKNGKRRRRKRRKPSGQGAQGNTQKQSGNTGQKQGGGQRNANQGQRNQSQRNKSQGQRNQSQGQNAQGQRGQGQGQKGQSQGQKAQNQGQRNQGNRNQRSNGNGNARNQNNRAPRNNGNGGQRGRTNNAPKGDKKA